MSPASKSHLNETSAAPHIGSAEAPRARRLSREDRRKQLLDVAVEMIVDRGLSRFSLEDVASRAGVSTPLIYKYFPRREDLLKAVLEREYVYLRGSGLQNLPSDLPFVGIIKAAIQRSFRYLYERGPIMRLLASDRAVTDLVQGQDRNERSQMTHFFERGSEREFEVTANEAAIISILTVNAPILSTRTLRRRGIKVEEATEVWTRFVLGGWAAMKAHAEARRSEDQPDA